MNRFAAVPALLIVIAVSACSGDGGSLTPSGPAPVTQSQTSERAPDSYGGIPAIVRLPATVATACPSASPSPVPTAAANAVNRHALSYGGIPMVSVGVTASVTAGCSL